MQFFRLEENCFMKPYVTWKEIEEKQKSNARNLHLLTEENGCVAGCRSGITIYADLEYREPGVHDDQEGFFVLEGEGYAKLDDLEFPIAKGDSFIAAPGVAHTIRTKAGCEPVRVFWFHSAV